MRVGLRPSSPDQSLTLPELRPTFGRKLLDRERGSARHCGLNLLAHLSLGRSGTPLRGGGVLFRHAASLSGMSQLTACAISTSQGTRSGSGRGMRPSANALASSMRFWGKVQGAGRSCNRRFPEGVTKGPELAGICATVRSRRRHRYSRQVVSAHFSLAPKSRFPETETARGRDSVRMPVTGPIALGRKPWGQLGITYRTNYAVVVRFR
jgi:hypothetical protein